MDRNHFVEAEERRKQCQPHLSTLRHLGTTIIHGCEAVVDAGLNTILDGTDYNPRVG